MASSIYILSCIIAFSLAAVTQSQLSSSYYSSSCPLASATIKASVLLAVVKERRMAASLLRLHFHDCFVNGCDGSVLLDDNATFTGEKTAGPNLNSLRGFDVIDTIKSRVEILCKQVVSCADILAIAARESVVAVPMDYALSKILNQILTYEDSISFDGLFQLGGPSWTVQLGRRDATTASLSTANSDIPNPASDLSTIISQFSNKGLTTTDMIALSGAHTIGQARCTTFRARLYNEANIDSSYAASLKSNCPSSGGDNNLSPLDTTTPNLFDNSYYKNLINSKGLLHSDQELYNNGSTDAQVSTYLANSAKFFSDFTSAMLKMGAISPLTGSSGEIRTNCRTVN